MQSTLQLRECFKWHFNFRHLQQYYNDQQSQHQNCKEYAENYHNAQTNAWHIFGVSFDLSVAVGTTDVDRLLVKYKASLQQWREGRWKRWKEGVRPRVTEEGEGESRSIVYIILYYVDDINKSGWGVVTHVFGSVIIRCSTAFKSH